MIELKTEYVLDVHGNKKAGYYGNAVALIVAGNIKSVLPEWNEEFPNQKLVIKITATEGKPDYEYEGTPNPEIRSRVDSFFQSL